MRKFILFLLIFCSSFVLLGCSEEEPIDNEKPVELTPFEKVQEAKAALSIGDVDNVITNLVFPKRGLHETIISWTSDKPTVISNAGAVVRPTDEDVKVKIVAKIEFGSSMDTKIFNVTVKKIPSTSENKLIEMADAFVLYPNNTIACDTIVLPRIADQFLIYIDYEIDNPNVIDYQGNVNRTSSEQKVNVTATFKLEGLEQKRTYQLTVKPKPTDSVIITENDSRILRKVSVTNNVELIAALNNAKPGDGILLENGRYRNVNIYLNKSGTEQNPIIISAKNPGMVTIEGESSIEIEANHVIVANLIMTNGSPSIDRGVIVFKGNHLRLTNCKIDDFDLSNEDYKWVSLTGQYHEIDRNVFDHKSTGGSLLTIWRDDTSPQFHHIYNNEFKNYRDGGGLNGYETIRVGTSNNSQSDSYVIIEGNLFENVDGEIEIISIKSGRNIVKGNTFVESMGMVTSRHGKNNMIIDNVFLAKDLKDSGGIRLYDGGHIVRNNYIEKVNTTSNTRGGIVVHSGNSVPGGITVLNSQWTAYNVLIENNTFIDSIQSILFCGKYNFPAQDVIIRNNHLEARSGEAALRFDKQPINATFENNFFYASTLSDRRGNYLPTSLPGITFSTTIPNTPVNGQGLKLVQNLGAKDLTIHTSSNTGVTWD